MRTKNPNSALRLAVAVPLSLVAVLLAVLPARGDPNEENWRNWQPDEQAWLVARPIEYKTIETGYYGAFKVSLFRLISSEKEWNCLMDSLGLAGDLLSLPGPEAPAGVDWDREAVVLVTMGEFSDLRCSVGIREVRRIGYRALCDVEVDVSPPLRIQVPTSAYYIGKIDRRGDIRTARPREDYRLPVSSLDVPEVRSSDSKAFVNPEVGRPTQRVSWSGIKAREL